MSNSETPETDEPRPEDDEFTLGALVRGWLEDTLNTEIPAGTDHDPLGHISPEVRAFHVGDRSKDTADLGDISGVVELRPQFGTGLPPRLRWVVESPYWRGRHVVDVGPADPDSSLTLHAGVPGLYTVRLESEDGAGILSEVGRTVVSAPWFARVSIDSSFDSFLPATGMDRERLLRRTRTVANYLLSEANVRTVWVDPPFGETLPPQYDTPLPSQPPGTETFFLTGFSDSVSRLNGQVHGGLIEVDLKADSTVDVGELATGASLYVGDVSPTRDSPLEVIFDSLPDRLDLEEELTARYLGLEIAHHVFRGMGVETVDDETAKLGNLMYPGLGRIDERPFVEWFVLGIRIHSPEAFPDDVSFLDRVQTYRERHDIVLDRDSFGNPKPPHTGLDVLAGLYAEARQTVERVAPLPTSPPAGQPTGSFYRVINNAPYVRSGPPDFAKVYETDADGNRSVKMLMKGSQVSIEETSSNGKYARVAGPSGTDLGWTWRDNLSRPFKDDTTLDSVSLTPQETVTIESDWSREKRRLAETYNRLGGLMAKLAETTGMETAGTLAIWYIESAGREHTVDDAIIRFENHKFWDLWGEDHSGRFDDFFQYCGRSPVTVGTTQCSETCANTGSGYPRRYRCHRYRLDTSESWTCLHTPNSGKNAREYEALEQAGTLGTDELARRCISIGGPQILGTNYWIIGYESASAMYNAFQADERAHVLGFFDFCKHTRDGKAIEYMKQGKWAAFAGIYNGKGKEQKYGTAIEEKYNLAKEFLPE